MGELSDHCEKGQEGIDLAELLRRITSGEIIDAAEKIKRFAVQYEAEKSERGAKDEFYEKKISELNAEIRGLKIEKAELEKKLGLDGMMKIYGNTEFKKELENSIARAELYAQPLSVIMVDIDYFKRINDERGHQAGDEVLRQLADVIKGVVRNDDCIYRYGGEEVGIRIPQCGLDAATAIAERIRAAVENNFFVYETKDAEGNVVYAELIDVSASLGISTYDPKTQPRTTTQSMIEEADAALKHSKVSGRNRTTVFIAKDQHQIIGSGKEPKPFDRYADN